MIPENVVDLFHRRCRAFIRQQPPGPNRGPAETARRRNAERGQILGRCFDLLAHVKAAEVMDQARKERDKQGRRSNIGGRRFRHPADKEASVRAWRRKSGTLPRRFRGECYQQATSPASTLLPTFLRLTARHCRRNQRRPKGAIPIISICPARRRKPRGRAA